MANKSKRPSRAQKNIINPATAPYNFVSLPKHSVVAPFATDAEKKWEELTEEGKQKRYADYVRKEGKHTGFLELTIETLTPCFINNVTEPSEETDDVVRTFFRVGDACLIAGSSLRGMVKNLFKIISAGAMRPEEDLEDRRLYFRSVAGESDSPLKQSYEESIQGVSPGFLIRTVDGNYFISPAEESEEKAGGNPAYLNGLQIHWDEAGAAADLVSGRMPDKRKYTRVIHPRFAGEERLSVPPEVIREYRGDLQRAEGFNLLDFPQAKRNEEAADFTGQKDTAYIIPCFYTTQPKNRKVIRNFGHCRHYRVPYKYSVGEFVPRAVKNCPVDLSEAVFGNKNLWASRLFFEDAVALDIRESYPAKLPHPLLKPNPTSYQLYLTQGKSNASAQNHWGKMPQLVPPIRGYKLYWHNGAKNAWEFSVNEKELPGMKKIMPLKEGTVFRGRIRFRDLSNIELGALCAVFHLGTENQRIAYKIGQGKSIGMGSIRIDTTLYTEDRELAYCQVFAEDNGGWWQEPEQQEAELFINDFEAYRDNQLEDKEGFYASLQELAALLDFNVTKKPNWSKKIETMSATDKNDRRFRDRISLTKAMEVYRSK